MVERTWLTLVLACLACAGWVCAATVLYLVRVLRSDLAAARREASAAREDARQERDRADRAIDQHAAFIQGQPISWVAMQKREEQQERVRRQEDDLSEMYALEVGEPPAPERGEA